MQPDGSARLRWRLASGDGLRAVAALAIVAYHVEFFVPTGPGWLRDLFAQLRVGVWIFFALSGYLLYRPWARRHLAGGDAPSLGAYARNRVVRIFPAYWVALVFFTAIHRTGLDVAAGLGSVVRHFTLTQIYGGGFVESFRGIPPTWSLAVELSFYLTLPIYAWLVGHAATRIGAQRAEWSGLGVLTAVWVAWTLATVGDAIKQQWLPNFTVAFGAGMALAVVTSDPTPSDALTRASRWLGGRVSWAWLGAAAILVLRSRLHIKYENGFTSQVFYVAAALLAVAATVFGDDGRSVVVRVLRSPPARFLGRISYGIFLWHYLLIVIARDDWVGAAHRNAWTVGALALGGAIVAATLSWYVVERPILLGTRRATVPFRVSLAVVTLGALCWRVLYVLAERGRLVLNGDAAYYHFQSTAIARGVGFVDPFQWQQIGRTVPSAGHPPAYLLYLAAFTRLGMGSETAHRLASCLLGAATVAVIGLVGRRLGGARVGIVAAIAAAAYANLWINDEMLMSESMAALATACVLLAVLRYRDRPGARRALELGAAVAFAALSRAELLALAVLVVVPLVLAARTITSRVRARHLVVALVTVGALVTPWVLYNVGRFDHPVYMSNGLGGVLLTGNCDQTYHGPLLGYWYAGCGGRVATDLRGDESDHEVAWRTQGLHYVRTHLGRFPVVALARAGRMWAVYAPRQDASLDGSLEGRGVSASRLALGQYAVLLPFAIAGLYVLRRRRTIVWPYVAIAALATFTAVTSFGITRYRIAVDTMLPALGAVAAVAAVDALRRRRTPRPAPVDLRMPVLAPAGTAPPHTA